MTDNFATNKTEHADALLAQVERLIALDDQAFEDLDPAELPPLAFRIRRK